MFRVILSLALLLSIFIHATGQVIHTLSGDKYPWTALPTLDGQSFRFVILADRTGGEQRGVFDKAIGFINTEKADFVISIGDMIDGYTQDKINLDKQWDNFNSSILAIQAPFFYAAGNHDISNTVMETYWLEKFGYTYYHFSIGDNLFLVLNTENEGDGNISKTQADYFLDVLEKQASGKKVFVFMHRPLWQQKNMNGYAPINMALKKYDATVFCGHEHWYLKEVIDGIPHYMLATLGGGSDLRGVSLGEFHHYMVVDVNKEDVSIKNVLADGIIIPNDVVNTSNVRAVDALRLGTWLKILPVVTDKQLNKKIGLQLVLSNQMDIPLFVKGVLPHTGEYRFSKDSIQIIVSPLSRDTVSLDLLADNVIDIDRMKDLNIELSALYMVGEKEINAMATAKVVLDYIRVCNNVAAHIICDNPGFIKEDWDWHGAKDGRFEMSVRCDTQNVYLTIKTFDDKLITRDDPLALQDKLFIQFIDNTSGDKNNYGYWQLASSGHITNLSQNTPNRYTLKADIHTEGNSLVASVVIPIEKNTNMFRLNVGFMDHDNSLNTKPSVLWWKPVWGSETDYTDSGIFKIKK